MFLLQLSWLLGSQLPRSQLGLYAKTARDHILTLIPFEGGRALTWDVAVACTTADSYIDLAVQDIEVRIQS